MIHKISADNPTFNEVEFSSGLNIVLADQSEDSDDKDSRNGLGKSSLIEIIHFCFGSDFARSPTLKKGALANWTFTCEATIGDNRVKISRSTSSPRTIVVEGPVASWPQQPVIDDETGKPSFSIEAWKDLLGKLMFDLPLGPSRQKFGPTFRQVISYFARPRREGYSSPFSTRQNQPSYQVQVINSFLLDLSWEYAVEWQNLKLKEDELKSFKKGAQTGYFSDVVGTLGELEAVKLRLQQKVQTQNSQISSFRVHPQYKEMELEANRLTKEIHVLANKNVSSRRTVDFYEQSLKEDKAAPMKDVETIYKEVGVVFPDQLKKRLEDVVNFHDQVTTNRKDFIKDEIAKVRRAISGREEKVRELSDRRASVLDVLKTHGALDEYTKLQNSLNETKTELEDVKRRIELLKKFESGKSALRIEKEELLQNTRRDYDEREESRIQAINLFNECSEALYNKPGQLIINVTDSGYKFDIEIEREESDGIRLMEIFCYDMVLSRIWSSKPVSPGFLIHDSTIYADVDERQIATALKVSKDFSEESGFQYICCLNSDKVPWNLLGDDFDLRSFVRLELKDQPDDQSLFGFRF